MLLNIIFLYFRRAYYHYNNRVSASLRIYKHPSIRPSLRLYYFLFWTKKDVLNSGGDENIDLVVGTRARAQKKKNSRNEPRLFKGG